MSETKSGRRVLFLGEAGSPTAERIVSKIIDSENDSLQTIERFDLVPLNEIGSESVDLVVTFMSQTSGAMEKALMMELWRVLVSNGSIYSFFTSPSQAEQSVINFNITGFLDTTSDHWAELVQVKANKSQYKRGASREIDSALKEKIAKIWNDGDLDSSELLDENQILTEMDFEWQIPQKDCEDGGPRRKACKNCTCGRAEMENQKNDKKSRITLEMLENPGINSSCGSCALGDAFRCEGCPYRGLPQFKPGEKIILPEDFDYELIEK